MHSNRGVILFLVVLHLLVILIASDLVDGFGFDHRRKSHSCLSHSKKLSRDSHRSNRIALNNAIGGSDFKMLSVSKKPAKRFGVGDAIVCNCPEGWTLGRVIALDYREDEWPDSVATAPYQVMLEDFDRRLIYVPMDDDRICRKPTEEDLNTNQRLDALALSASSGGDNNTNNSSKRNKNLTARQVSDGVTGYRDGRCGCCDSCPRSWSAVELYSEHYRAATRNGLPIVRHKADLGTVEVGTFLTHALDDDKNRDTLLPTSGFLQCPTLPRLPPGVTFEDNGSLSGRIRFDPHRGDRYRVEFVAVSTADWQNAGLVRLEITFEVVDNAPPPGFDVEEFEEEQQIARAKGERIMQAIYETWGGYNADTVSHGQCIERMTTALHKLRDLLEEHPRLDGGIWWTQLGGYHMNVHKLLENKLFECELYLGQALLMPDAHVRRSAEQNLEGCYQKRLLETALFMWHDGLDQVIRGEYSNAIETFRVAAAKKDGWGWAVNHGDIYISEAAARLLHGATLIESGGGNTKSGGREQLEPIPDLLDRARTRWNLGGAEHPWSVDIRRALAGYCGLLAKDSSPTSSQIDAFRKQTVVWCARALRGGSLFPPKTKPRRDDAEALRKRMPGHHPY